MRDILVLVLLFTFRRNCNSIDYIEYVFYFRNICKKIYYSYDIRVCDAIFFYNNYALLSNTMELKTK